MTKRTRLIAGSVVLSAVVAGGGTLAWEQYQQDQANNASAPIEASYGFDVTNKTLLADYSDEIVLARVVGKERNDVNDGTTVWSVQVQDRIKGSATEQVQVRQIGYIDDNGTHQMDAQPLLQPGRLYLLAMTNRDGPVRTLVAGPVAATPLESEEEATKLKKEFEAVVR